MENKAGEVAFQGNGQAVIHEDGAVVRGAVFCFIPDARIEAAQADAKGGIMRNGKGAVSAEKHFLPVCRNESPGSFGAFEG